MQKFTTSNYTEIESYPKQEWDIIIKGAACPDYGMQFNRRIPVISELCELPLAKNADLKREEVIAIVMYTGPMVCRHDFIQIGGIYSCMLFNKIFVVIFFICAVYRLQHHSS